MRKYTPEEVEACAKRMRFYDHQIAASILDLYASQLREKAIADGWSCIRCGDFTDVCPKCASELGEGA